MFISYCGFKVDCNVLCTGNILSCSGIHYSSQSPYFFIYLYNFQFSLLSFICVCSDAGDSLNDCRIMFLTEIYKIEEPGSLDETPAGSESPLKSRFKDEMLNFLW